MGYNYLNWILEKKVYIIVLISWAFSVALLTTLFDYSYLETIYKRSWSLSYIKDIEFVLKDEDCKKDKGWEKLSIGAWSGFKEGCICVNRDINELKMLNGIIPKDVSFHVSDKGNCNDLERDIKLLFPTCVDIPYVRPFMLQTYKGFDICVLYDNLNYHGISEAFYNLMKKDYDFKGDRIKKDDFRNFYNAINKVDVSPIISPEAITDIKFVNTTLVSLKELKSLHGIDTNEYQIINVQADYSVLVKRLKNEDITVRKNGISVIRKLINDIHLTNDLWCAYLDIAYPYKKMKLNTGFPEFGYEYCNDFYSIDHEIQYNDPNHYIVTYRKELFYDDDYMRSTKINFDSYSSGVQNEKYDFYNWNHGITQIYNSILYRIMNAFEERDPNTHSDKYRDFFYKNNLNPAYSSPLLYSDILGPKFEPVMVYENFLEGIGCFAFKEPEEHIEMISFYDKAHKATQLLVGINSIVFIILIVNFLAKFIDSKVFNIILFSSIVVLNFIGFIVSGALSFKYRILKHYMEDYQFLCQNDFTASHSSTPPMEVTFLQSIPFTLMCATLNSAMLFFAIAVNMFHLCRICCNKEDRKVDDSVFDFQHKQVDQSDVKSKGGSEISMTYRKDMYDGDQNENNDQKNADQVI